MKQLILAAILCFQGTVALTQSPSFDTIPPAILLDYADRSLKAATSLSFISFAYQAAGISMCVGAYRGNESMGLLSVALVTGIGGIGIQTNVPILARRAFLQVQGWDCPQEDLKVKERILQNIRITRAVSITRTCLPIAGFVAGGAAGLLFNSGSEYNLFVVCFAATYLAGLALMIPEVTFSELARKDIVRCKRKLSLGMSGQGVGMTIQL
jgi:hypothetical protein